MGSEQIGEFQPSLDSHNASFVESIFLGICCKQRKIFFNSKASAFVSHKLTALEEKKIPNCTYWMK